MELRAVGVEASPRADGWTRLWGDVLYGNGESGPERYWLEVPDDSAPALSASGDAWLCWLAPLAATLGEDLWVRVPCDATLLRDVREVLRVWAAWYPNLRAVDLRADLSPTGDRAPARRTASFFSGGVDSFFTALRHANGDGTPETLAIDDHVFVWGFDIPLSNEPAFRRVRDSVAQAAGEMGRGLLPVVTNLRDTRFREADWALLTHGPALAGVAHAIGNTYRTVLIPSSAGYRDLRRWGSHPLTDPMMSSSKVRIAHDGAAFMRVEKTEYVAQNPLVLRHLRVCYHDPDGGNCGACNNCYRTMLALEALNALERTSAFDRSCLDLRRAERVFLPNDFDVRQFGYILSLARRVGRNDISRAVERTLRRSRRRKRWVQLARRCRDVPVAWRWAQGWERRLLRSWIT